MRRSIGLVFLVFLFGCPEDEPGSSLVEQEHEMTLGAARRALGDGRIDEAWKQLAMADDDPDSRFNDEIQELKEGIQQKYIAFHLGKATRLKDDGQRDAALAHIDMALKADPENSIAQDLRKIVEQPAPEPEAKEPDKVEPKQPVEAPSKLEKLVMQGKQLVRGKKHAEAIRLFHQVLDQDPRNCSAWLYLGIVLSREGKWKQAVSRYEKFVWFCPDHKKAGQARKIIGKWEKRKKGG